MLGWLRRFSAVLVLVGFVPVATTSCFGTFQLTRNLYKFNQEVNPDKWIQWFVFLVLSISYGLAFVIDAVVANSMEFWSGQNPITADAGSVKVVRGPKGEVATFTWTEEGTVSVVVEGVAPEPLHLTLRTEARSLGAWDDEGNLLARVTDVGGQPMLVGGSALGR